MSMLLTAKAFQIKVKNPIRKLILLKLADNANDFGECYPSNQYIADMCECSKTCVKNHIKALIEMGLLSKKARYNKDGCSSNLYVLHLDEGEANGDLGGGSSRDLPRANGDLGGGSSRDPITSHSINQSINHSISKPDKPDKQEGNASVKKLLEEFGVVDNELIDEFIALRKFKKAPITKTVMKLFRAEALKAGISVEEAVRIATGNSWKGFKADWYLNKNFKTGNSQQFNSNYQFNSTSDPYFCNTFTPSIADIVGDTYD